MKKILIIISLLFFTTGCSCEYNLTIENNTYKEEVKFIGSNSSELSSFNNNWQIPIDKDKYNIGLDPESTGEYTSSLYKYNLSGNTLAFNYDFNVTDYPNSSAVSNCYNTLSVINRSSSVVISTSKDNICFDNYPNLDSLIVKIKVDMPVTSHNADTVNGSTYTWIINKNNASNKGINLVLASKNNESGNTGQENNPQNNNSKNRDYSLYIFCGILLITMLLVYFIFNKLKNKNNGVDD